MTEPTLDRLRYEIKFVAPANERSSILQWVRNHSAGFSRPYPDRQINNVYFDSHELSAFHENVSGVSRRSKVRWRWYGESNSSDRGTLEVKRRRGGLGWKLSYKTRGANIGGRAAGGWRSIRQTIRRDLDPGARVWFDANPLTVLINHYERRYFVSGDGAVRLTVDWNQRVYDQKLRSTPNIKRASNLPETIVVELKFPVQEHNHASSMVQGMPLRLSRNSKYVIGVQSISNGG
ncbi:MAG: VTC domain-containing protein [Myxococcota bacterium]|nr:VTC domain-containing protein [Myxococcota bacterium]